VYTLHTKKMSRSRIVTGLSKLIQTSNKSLPRGSFLASTTNLQPNNFAPLATPLNSRAFATQGDADIAKFLSEEISTEKSNQKLLPKLDGWTASFEGSEVRLTKGGAGGEKLIVSLNVNHTVDSAEPDDGQGEAPEMLSRPNFEVDIIKSNGKTLSFTCSYLHPEEMSQEAEGPDDIFAIDEVTMFDGEKISDKNYAVAGDILDGYLYDLFMTMLDERGVTNDFVEGLSDWCTAHEHSQYINLLQEIEKFAKM